MTTVESQRYAEAQQRAERQRYAATAGDVATVGDMHDSTARTVFADMRPTTAALPINAPESIRTNHTLPILLVGSMAIGLSVAGQAEQAVASPATAKKSTTTSRSAMPTGTTAGHAATKPVPATYVVKAGDTVSSIASRHGLTTSSVLALNGLRASSLIFPGQVLRLTSKKTAGASSTVGSTPSGSGSSATSPSTNTPTTNKPTTTKKYTVKSGDTVGKIAAKFAVTTQSVLTANSLGWSSIIYPGQVLTIRTAAAPPPSDSTATPPTTGNNSGNGNGTTDTPTNATPAAGTPSTGTPSSGTPSSGTPSTTPPPAPPVNGSYLIKSGDTLSKIAAKFGITLSALLKANSLSLTSIIYAGRTLVIPGVATTTTASTGSVNVTLLSDEQESNAKTIIAVARNLGVSDYGIVIALATAMQESGLRNLTYGDLDSVGLFQQRPSSGWGPRTKLLNTEHAAKLFFGGPKNPNAGKTRGLLDIPGWQSMSVTRAAQSVQISAHPNAYAKWEASARFWLSDLG